METHDVKRVCFKDKALFHDVWVEYEAETFYCELADEYYDNEEMIVSNNRKIKDAYRKKMGLLVSSEIKDIRSKYEITQSDLCVVLGWGEKTIARYETHQIQDKAHDSILKKIEGDPQWYLYLLNESKNSFPADRYRKYYEAVCGMIEEKQEMYLKQYIESQYAVYQENAVCNGGQKLDLDKVADVICYFSNADEVTKLYKVKLMKLLWYADFLSYKKRDKSITGMVYRALPMGAVPIGHDSIIKLKGILFEELDMGDGVAYRFLKTENNVYTTLEKQELQILDEVIARLGRMSKDEIVSYMHGEEGYKKTKIKDVISYEYAKDLSIG